MTALRALRILLLHLTAAWEREGAKPLAARPVRSRRGARASVVWFAAGVAALHGAALFALSDARVRDPEYGRRAANLRARLAENPGRPLVVITGSSRTAMGICPSAWEAVRPANPARPDPLIFNMSVLGSGPVMELMTLRRIYADGFTPSVVLLEYWPPFLGSDASWAETNRIATDRLLDCDRPLVRGYFPDPDRIEREMDRQRVNPIFASRARLMNHVSPNAILPTQRANAAWEGLDPWGWKPGVDMKPELAQWRTDAVAMCGDIYRPLLAKYRLSRDVERALRDSVALAREHGATVGFLFMPESSDFRRLYPPRTEQKVRDHLANLSRELNVPVIDTRAWMPDDDVADSFHLSRQGAAAFTRKLGPVVAEMLDPEARP